MNSPLSFIRYNREILKKKFISVRFFTFIFLQFLITIYFTSNIANFARDVSYPASQWCLPLLYSNSTFIMLLMVTIIYYFSDVPFMHHNEMYQIIRVGRKKWVFGKIIGIVLFSFIMPFIQMIMVLIPLIGNLRFETGWGKVLYTLSLTQAGVKYNTVFSCSIVQMYTPLRAMLVCFLISALLTTLIGLVMYALSLTLSRLVAVTVTTIIIFFGIISRNIIAKHYWILRMSPLSWLDLSSVATKPGHNLPSFIYTITVLISAIVILSIIILVRIKNINFQWNKED